MKKIGSFILLLSIILFFSTSDYFTWKVHAQDDVTKVNRFYSADTVASGLTTPNTRVKYVGKNNYGETLGVFSSVSNSKGIFKLYVGDHPANTVFTINTYDSNGDIIDSDEVFVLTASLNAHFGIFFGYNLIDNQGVFADVSYTASKDSKIEIMVNDKIIKTVIAGVDPDHQYVLGPEIHLGDFVKMRVSKGNVIKTYELLATSYDIYDKFMYQYPIFTSKFTTWSDSIIFYLPPNLKYSGLISKTQDLLPTGAIKHVFDGKIELFPLTLYDKEFQNVIYSGYIHLNTSPKPVIDPVSQISNDVTGTATANSLITVLDEQETKLGEGVTDENGRFVVPVNKLEPDTVIKVETRMPNSDKYDYSYTSVEEVYVDELSDNNAYVTGQSSFGTEADVFLTDSNMKSLSLDGITATSSKKNIGKFIINKGSKFKLYIGKQKANTIIQLVLRENGKLLTLPSKIVQDKTAPVISGIKNNGLYKVNVIPVFNEGTAKIDGKTYVKGTKITKDGHHVFIVKDNAGNKRTVVFTVDKIAPSKPTVNKIKSSSHVIKGKGEKGTKIYVYKGKVKAGYTIVNSKGKYSLNIKKQRKGVKLTVYSVDKAGNKSKPKIIKVS